jgi:hypothetical protein
MRVDKQRLLELAGITEATYAGQNQWRSDMWIVIEHDHNDVDQVSGVYGPFSTYDQAKDFMWAKIRLYERYWKNHVEPGHWTKPPDMDWFDIEQINNPQESLDELEAEI